MTAMLDCSPRNSRCEDDVGLLARPRRRRYAARVSNDRSREKPTSPPQPPPDSDKSPPAIGDPSPGGGAPVSGRAARTRRAIARWVLLLPLAMMTASIGCSPRRAQLPTEPRYDWSASPFCVSIRSQGARACDEHNLDGRVNVGDPNFVTHVIRSKPQGAEVYWLVAGKIRHIGYTPFTLVVPVSTSGRASYCVGAACSSGTGAFIPGKSDNMEIVYVQTPAGWSGVVQ